MGGAGNISVRRAGSPVCPVHCSVLNLENGAWNTVGIQRIFIKRMKVENDQTFCGLTTESEVCTWVSHSRRVHEGAPCLVFKEVRFTTPGGRLQRERVDAVGVNEITEGEGKARSCPRCGMNRGKRCGNRWKEGGQGACA